MGLIPSSLLISMEGYIKLLICSESLETPLPFLFALPKLPGEKHGMS